jgi:quinolinate synthase
MNDLIAEIAALRKEKHAVILAHSYQVPAVQDIADVVGDSLELARRGRDTDADVIVLCGVSFMAESAKILSPHKTVLLPRLDAGCPLADMITPEQIARLRMTYPGAGVVCYINSSAAVKAASDVCCTSSNAVAVVRAMPQQQILFVPDQNLGYYVSTQVDKDIVLWEGFCATHHRLTADDVIAAKTLHSNAVVLAHPECNKTVLALADVITSTSGMLRYVAESSKTAFILCTEEGILHPLRTKHPDKQFYLASNRLVCPNMKRTKLEDVAHVLRTGEHAIEVDATVREKAHAALDLMLQYSSRV